jgi:hypothetical protein
MGVAFLAATTLVPALHHRHDEDGDDRDVPRTAVELCLGTAPHVHDAGHQTGHRTHPEICATCSAASTATLATPLSWAHLDAGSARAVAAADAAPPTPSCAGFDGRAPPRA